MDFVFFEFWLLILVEHVHMGSALTQRPYGFTLEKSFPPPYQFLIVSSGSDAPPTS